MRPLTPFASYLDNDGLPLVGRLRFCNSDGSPANVFESDGVTSLGSSVFTDSSGRPVPQPFLEDHDYLIYFDKYVGINTMTEDTEEDSWSEQGSAIDRYNTVGVHLEEQCYRTVDTIAALRTTHALASDEMVMLLGYNQKYDKEPIFYRWDQYNIDLSNGGSIVKVTDVSMGRWVFVECPHSLDVRHFGAFPNQGMTSDPTQRYRVQMAAAYAHSNWCGLFFPADAEDGYYDISGLALYDVDCDENARVFAIEGSTTIINGVKRVYCDYAEDFDGTIRLIDDVVRTSWVGDSRTVSLEPSARLVVDMPLYGIPQQWSNIKVDMDEYIGANATFDNCDLSSCGKITGNITLKNMAVKGDWFVEGYDWVKLSMVNCTILPCNFDDKSVYVTLKNKENQKDYGDLGGATLTGVNLLDGCFLENAVLAGCTVKGSSEFHNVSGSVKLDTAGTGDMAWMDSFITLTNVSNATVASFLLMRGSVSGGTAVIMDGNLRLEDSVVSTVFSVVGDIVAYRNTIEATISHTPTSGNVREQFVGNTFNAQLNINPFLANSKFVARWMGNYGTVANPINLNRLNIDPDDAEHDYVYRDNGGTFLPDITECKAVTLTVKTVPNATDSRTESVVRNAGTLTLIKPTRSSPDYDHVGAGAYNYGGNYFDTADFFRVGTTPFRVHADIAMIARQNLYSQTVTPVKQVLGAEFVSGNTFRLKTPLNGEWTGSNKSLSSFPSMYSTVMLWNFEAVEAQPSELPADETFSVEIRYEALERHL